MPYMSMWHGQETILFGRGHISKSHEAKNRFGGGAGGSITLDPLGFSEFSTLCLKKVSHLMIDNNFSKCGPIFFARCYASAALVVIRCLYVCLSVCHVLTFCRNE